MEFKNPMELNSTYKDDPHPPTRSIIFDFVFFNLILIIYMTISLIILRKVKCEVDRAAKVVLVLYFVSYLARVAVADTVFIKDHRQYQMSEYVNIADDLVLILITISYYYYAFDMMAVKIRISAVNKKEDELKQKLNKRGRFCLIASYIIITIPYMALQIKIIVLHQYAPTFLTVEAISYTIIDALYTVIDTFILIMFSNLMIFFIRGKRAKLL